MFYLMYKTGAGLCFYLYKTDFFELTVKGHKGSACKRDYLAHKGLIRDDSLILSDRRNPG